MGGERLDPSELWRQYSQNKQTVRELAVQYSVSESTVKRRLRPVVENFECKDFPRCGTVLMDTTYFGRDWGVTVVKDFLTGKILCRKYVRHERLIDYRECTDFILSKGYQIWGIVCDGFKGIFKQYSVFSVQMCQYHFVSLIRRYLTRNPKLQAGKELWIPVKNITKLTENEFIESFQKWEDKWIPFLKERTKDEKTGKSHFTHKKLRSAWLSIKKHLPYLFVFEKVSFKMPNTNNALEGTFTALKNSLRNHGGMSKENRKRFIDGFLKA
ncbi:MAG: transposase [Tannerella sp.]|nr:transposase [Tannerella sp.]